MILALLVCQFALTVANPFHKYPYVFLLDVGNEELEKTNTEQIRISLPGGSLALRYPAIGDSDTIAHVRVSGIDFGTDLKANIVDGGPGYKYVVIVFIGNQGVPYDAVMSIQTVPDDSVDKSSQNSNVSSNITPYNEEDANNSAEEIDDVSSDKLYNTASDENDSSEDTSNEIDSKKVQSENSLLRQESSSVYNYVKNNAGSENSNNEAENDDINIENYAYSQNSDENIDDDDSIENREENDINNEHVHDTSELEHDPAQDVDAHDDSVENESLSRKDTYDRYTMLKPVFYDGMRVYPQNGVPFVLRNNGYYGYNPEKSVEFDQMFNDEETHEQSDTYNDSNNNYFDSDDNSAVAL